MSSMRAGCAAVVWQICFLGVAEERGSRWVFGIVGCDKHRERHRASLPCGLGAQSTVCASFEERCRVDFALQVIHGVAMLVVRKAQVVAMRCIGMAFGHGLWCIAAA